MRPLTLLLCALIVPPAAYADSRPPLGPEHLRVEYLENPLGIDEPAPRFMWWMVPEGRDQMQAAHQIRVAEDLETLETGDAYVWDSGKVESPGCCQAVYGGPPLESFTRYYWTVRVWDQTGQASLWSAPAWFETAMMQPQDLRAKWICGREDGQESNGFHTELRETQGTEWVMVDLGQDRPIAEVRLFPARPYNWKTDAPGFGFPLRYRVEAADNEDFNNPETVADFTDADVINPGATPVVLAVNDLSARYVRLTATKLYGNGEGRFALALAEMEVAGPAGGNWAYLQPVTASSALETNGWRADYLVDGFRVSGERVRTSPVLRREFVVDGEIASARAYVTGLGYYELWLNGEKVGDRVLDPAHTVYDKRTLYSAYDVTDRLVKGPNAAGLLLGHGWHDDTPAGWMQLRVTLENGTVQTYTTGRRWKWSLGPIIEESLYHGETYDARLELPGWASPGYDDSAWQLVRSYDNPPANLRALMMQPIRVTQTLPVASISPLEGGKAIVDFGQNLTGWVRLQADLEEGQAVTIRHAELLHEDGSLNPANLRSARATDIYVAQGADGPETYRPRFTQHGFRYAEVSGIEDALTPDMFEAEMIHTDFERSGTFNASSDLLNAVTDLTLWSIRGNSMSIPTDCPQRDERMGWMGDAHLAAEPCLLAFDSAAFWTNYLRVIANSQNEKGEVPDTCPPARFGKQDGDPAWAIAYPLIVHYLHLYHGDTRVIEEHYDNIVAWYKTLEGHAKGHIVTYGRYGDWVALEKTPKPLVSTAMYYQATDVLQRFSEVLGKEGEAARYAQRMKDIAAAFHEKFYDAQRNRYAGGSQTAQVLPLAYGIVPEGERTDVHASLRQAIVEEHGGHLTTGIMGTRDLFDVLADAGHEELAYDIALETGFPSYGYMLAKGATTLWELWEYKTGRGMNSHNHQMFGSVLRWYFDDVAGLTAPPAPGYERITVAPVVTDDLDFAQAHAETPRGVASVAWYRAGGGLTMTVTIPPNSAAEVHVPLLGKTNPRVSMDEGPAPPGRRQGDAMVYELGSGSYLFAVR